MLKFGSRVLDEVIKAELDGWMASMRGAGLGPKSLKQIRTNTVGFFSWCRDSGHLSDSRRTEAEKMGAVRLAPVAPEIYTPAELSILLKEVGAEFKGWLGLCSLCGVRTSEAMRLDWEDVKWDRGLLILPAEKTKTGRRRTVILPAALEAWFPDKPTSGLVCAGDPTKFVGSVESETTRLGKFLGGWKKNALRHSWISYRAAAVGTAQTSLEAGNSEAVLRANYLDAVTKEEADAWFGATP